MKFFKLISAIIIMFSVNSCQQILDNYYEKQAQQNYVSPYKGVWLGSFSGDYSGTLKIEIYKSGSLEVTRTTGSSTDTFYGAITSNGSFNGTVSPTSGFQIFGSLTSNGQANGNWKQQNSTGFWTLVKQ